MRILIVGGTVYVGRALTDVALARGHEVTLLNRGKSAQQLPAGVEHLMADRNGDLSVLHGRGWDAVIDTCAYFPRQVRTLRAALAGAPHYTLISSVSAYADHSRPGLNEASPLAEPILDESITTVDANNYGPLKAGCETVAGEGTLVIRPGIIVGPYDPTGRFGYWIRRMNAASEFLAPDEGAEALQVIDARDLAEWTVRMIEQRVTGAFNAVGPSEPLTFRQFIEAGLAALGHRAKPIWVPAVFLNAEEIEGGKNLPLWVPATAEKYAGLFRADGCKAWSAGLTHRDLATTIKDCVVYESSVAEPKLVGLSRDDELALLRKFKDTSR